MTFRYFKAAHVLQQGGIVAYPTESVYGLGCDPFNREAVGRLLRLKQRPVRKGLIIVAASFEQLLPWLSQLPLDLKHRCCASWPGPVTWVIPLELMNQSFPYWITGGFSSVAIRVSAHPIVKDLCEAFDGPIVSTSANLSGRHALKTAIQVRLHLGSMVDHIVVGNVGGSVRPTTIKHLVTDRVIRF